MRDLQRLVPDGFLPAASYLRKSVVKEDKDAESIEVQRERNDAYAKMRQWTITAEYCDAGKSGADRFRPDWRRLFDDIESGAVKRLVVREQARLVRDDLELMLFLQLIKKADIEVFDSYGRQIMSNPETKIRGILDADYREQVSINVSNAKASNAAKGVPAAGGRRPYGYTHKFEKLIPEEISVMKEAAERFLAGETLYGICADFNRRSIMKYCLCAECFRRPLRKHLHKGAKWESGHLSKILRRPENAGIRTYKGDEVAVGSWPCVWNEDQRKAEEFQRRLMAKLIAVNKPWSDTNARKYLLVGILVCDHCGVKLGSKTSPRQYVCRTGRGCGKVSRNMQRLDDYMIRRVYEDILNMPEPSDKPVEDTVADEIDRLQSEWDEVLEAKQEGEISLREYIAIKGPIEQQLKDLRTERATRTPLPVSTAEEFLNADTNKQRATIRRMYPVVGVKPAGKGKTFHPSQLVIP